MLKILLSGVMALAMCCMTVHGLAFAAVMDGTGTNIEAGRDAHRIVSLAPNVTEMLYFLGLGGRVIGRSDYCDYPEAASKLPSVGGFSDTSIELVIALKPDLVVAYQGNSRELVDQLRTAGLTVLAFSEAKTVAEVGSQMRELWTVAAAPEAAMPPQLIVWEAQLAKETIKSYPSADYFRMFFGYPDEAAYTCAPGSFIDDLMLRAGAVNVVPAGDQRWPQVSAEFILASHPDWILTSTSCTEDQDPAAMQAQTIAELQSSPVWSALPAVKDGQVIVLDSDILLRPGPRLLNALRALNHALTKHTMDKLLREAS